MFVCLYVCTYVCVYVCTEACLYVCMYVCGYVSVADWADDGAGVPLASVMNAWPYDYHVGMYACMYTYVCMYVCAYASVCTSVTVSMLLCDVVFSLLSPASITVQLLNY